MRFADYGRTLRVEGGLRAQSTRGAIGESWWSKRFLAVLEGLALGTRLTRGRSYARQGQVLSLDVAPGTVRAVVQGSRPRPYDVTIGLPIVPAPAWDRIEQALAAQAIFTARLLAGEMPAQIEEVFAGENAPLFPTSAAQLRMECSCPDWSVPCKHLAATFYLLAEAFDADPFEILHWRGRDRETLLANLRHRRDSAAATPTSTSAGRARAEAARSGIGAAAALVDLVSPALADSIDRFWVPAIPLPPRPSTWDTEPDLLLRQLPTPAAGAGGAELVDRLRPYYRAFRSTEPPS